MLLRKPYPVFLFSHVQWYNSLAKSSVFGFSWRLTLLRVTSKTCYKPSLPGLSKKGRVVRGFTRPNSLFDWSGWSQETLSDSELSLAATSALRILKFFQFATNKRCRLCWHQPRHLLGRELWYMSVASSTLLGSQHVGTIGWGMWGCHADSDVENGIYAHAGIYVKEGSQVGLDRWCWGLSFIIRNMIWNHGWTLLVFFRLCLSVLDFSR